MREITIEQIIQAVRQLCIEASCDLPKDVEQCIIEAAEREVSPKISALRGKIQCPCVRIQGWLSSLPKWDRKCISPAVC